MVRSKNFSYQNFQTAESRQVPYDILVDNIQDYAIFYIDLQGNITSWNTGGKLITGYSYEVIVGKHFSELYTPENISASLPDDHLKEAIKEGRIDTEGWCKKKDGSSYWASIVITAMFNAESKLIGLSIVIKDISVKKSLEKRLISANEQLIESEKRYRLLVEGVKDYAIFMLTPEGKIATWNAGAEKIKGYKAEEAIGQHFSIFYVKDAIEGGFPKYELLMAMELGRFEDEGWRLKKDGTPFWANVVITALYDSKNKHIGFSKITRDLTQKVKNEELMKKNKELLRINTDLDNFIYTASHDLKLPIANLEGLITIFSKNVDSKLYPSERDILKMMDSAIFKLRETVNDLVEITKAQKGLEDTVEEISFKEIVAEVKGDINKLVQESKARFVEVWEVKKFLYTKVNLRTILYNLLTNAIKYRSPERALKINISTYYEGKDIVLSVKDNGLGLRENQLSKLFTMFKRFHSHVDGAGIGLYITKRLIENKGGRIEVKSKKNIGTTFKIFFTT